MAGYGSNSFNCGINLVSAQLQPREPLCILYTLAIKGIAALERHGETQDVSQRTSCSSSSSFLSSLLVASREIVEGWKRGKGRGWLVARVDRNKKRAALALICKGISGITLSTLFSSSFSLSISLSLFHFFSFVLFLSDPNRDFFKKPSFHDLLG